RDVIIVSRDADYAAKDSTGTVLNHWLGDEFGQRVDTKIKITLSNDLARSLERLGETFSKKDIEIENKVLESSPPIGPVAGGITIIELPKVSEMTQNQLIYHLFRSWLDSANTPQPLRAAGPEESKKE